MTSWTSPTSSPASRSWRSCAACPHRTLSPTPTALGTGHRPRGSSHPIPGRASALRAAVAAGAAAPPGGGRDRDHPGPGGSGRRRRSRVHRGPRLRWRSPRRIVGSRAAAPARRRNPSEIQQALRHGATWLKAFPATVLGTGWFAAMRGPFPEVNLVATGGVSAHNAADYLAAGPAPSLWARLSPTRPSGGARRPRRLLNRTVGKRERTGRLADAQRNAVRAGAASSIRIVAAQIGAANSVRPRPEPTARVGWQAVPA